MTRTKYAKITMEEAIENLQFYLDTPLPRRASAATLHTINEHKEALSMAIGALKIQAKLNTPEIQNSIDYLRDFDSYSWYQVELRKVLDCLEEEC